MLRKCPHELVCTHRMYRMSMLPYTLLVLRIGMPHIPLIQPRLSTGNLKAATTNDVALAYFNAQARRTLTFLCSNPFTGLEQPTRFLDRNTHHWLT
jgi:hypothetical protein